MRNIHAVLLLNIIFKVIGSRVLIIDESGKALSDTVGPLNEGSRLSLFCETNGGYPSVLTWWKDTSLLDDSFVAMPRGIMRNELTLAYLSRGDLMSTLTCQASLPNATEPAEKSVSLDLNLKPLDVHITTLQRPLSAGRHTILKCQSRGSRPPAVITWWLGGKQLLNITVAAYDSTTISKLLFVPKPDDNGRVLSCRASNPVMNGNILEDHRVLEVHYIPKLSVTVGTPQSYISEGDAVYFDCNIIAHPSVTEVGWRFQDEPLYTNINAGIKVQNRSLLFHNINRKYSGNFSCVAANSEGEGVSDSVAIDVHYKPHCALNQRASYGVAVRQSVDIECLVDANPSNVKFHWYLNNTFRQIPLKSFTVNDTSSILSYTIKRESDYGHIMCAAENEVGVQTEACCFTLTPASVPGPVEDCVVTNETLNSAIVVCSPGYDGGLLQQFNLELYSSRGLVASDFDKESPEFELSDLPSGKSFIAVVFATNELGRSNAVALTITTKSLRKPEKDKIKKPISNLLGALIGIIGFLVLLAVMIIVICSQDRRSGFEEDIPQIPTAWDSGELKPGHQYI